MRNLNGNVTTGSFSLGLTWLAIVIVVFSGCGGAPHVLPRFAELYQANLKVKTLQLSPREEVQVRVVTPEQFAEADRRVEKYLADRRLAPEDVTALDAKEIRRLALDAFRVREDPQFLARLGRSSFIGSYTPMLPDSPELIAFAKGKGADFVVLSSKYLGDRTEFHSQPVLSSTSSTADVRDHLGQQVGTISGRNQTTSFETVPVRVDKWAIELELWRRLSPEEQSQFDAQYPR